MVVAISTDFPGEYQDYVGKCILSLFWMPKLQLLFTSNLLGWKTSFLGIYFKWNVCWNRYAPINYMTVKSLAKFGERKDRKLCQNLLVFFCSFDQIGLSINFRKILWRVDIWKYIRDEWSKPNEIYQFSNHVAFLSEGEYLKEEL